MMGRLTNEEESRWERYIEWEIGGIRSAKMSSTLVNLGLRNGDGAKIKSPEYPEKEKESV